MLNIVAHRVHVDNSEGSRGSELADEGEEDLERLQPGVGLALQQPAEDAGHPGHQLHTRYSYRSAQSAYLAE